MAGCSSTSTRTLWRDPGSRLSTPPVVRRFFPDRLGGSDQGGEPCTEKCKRSDGYPSTVSPISARRRNSITDGNDTMSTAVRFATSASRSRMPSTEVMSSMSASRLIGIGVNNTRDARPDGERRSSALSQLERHGSPSSRSMAHRSSIIWHFCWSSLASSQSPSNGAARSMSMFCSMTSHHCLTSSTPTRRSAISSGSQIGTSRSSSRRPVRSSSSHSTMRCTSPKAGGVLSVVSRQRRRRRPRPIPPVSNRTMRTISKTVITAGGLPETNQGQTRRCPGRNRGTLMSSVLIAALSRHLRCGYATNSSMIVWLRL